ncbi:MAG: hypothetical protein ABH864_00800 [archaeon]
MFARFHSSREEYVNELIRELERKLGELEIPFIFNLTVNNHRLSYPNSIGVAYAVPQATIDKIKELYFTDGTAGCYHTPLMKYNADFTWEMFDSRTRIVSWHTEGTWKTENLGRELFARFNRKRASGSYKPRQQLFNEIRRYLEGIAPRCEELGIPTTDEVKRDGR